MTKELEVFRTRNISYGWFNERGWESQRIAEDSQTRLGNRHKELHSHRVSTTNTTTRHDHSVFGRSTTSLTYAAEFRKNTIIPGHHPDRIRSNKCYILRMRGVGSWRYINERGTWMVMAKRETTPIISTEECMPESLQALAQNLIYTIVTP